MTFKVTPQDIKDGVSGDVWRCAVSVAIKRTLGEKAFLVFAWQSRKYPAIVYEFTRRFDAGEEVEPFSFELEEKK